MWLIALGTAWAADAQLVEPLDGGAWVLLREGDLEQPWSVAAAWSYTWAHRPLVLVKPDGNDPLVGGVITRELGLGVNLGGVLRLGVGLPRHRFAMIEGELLEKLPGDVALWTAITVVDADGDDGLEIAWYVHGDFATGSPDEWLGEDDGAIRGLLAIERPIGAVRTAANLGFALRPEVRLPGLDWGNRLEYGAGLRWDPLRQVGAGVELAGSTPLQFAGRAGAWPLEIAATTELKFTPEVSLSGALGTGLTHGLGSPALRAVAMLQFRQRDHADTDGDGMVDPRDDCVTDPEDRDSFLDADGCPEPDNDLDGLLDAVDECPNTAETANGWKDDDGCPDRATRVIVHVTSSSPERLEAATVRFGDLDRAEVLDGDTVERIVPAEAIELRVTAPGHQPYTRALALGEPTLTLEVVLEPLILGELTVMLVNPDGVALAGTWLGDDGKHTIPVEGLPLTLPAGRQELAFVAPGYAMRRVSAAVLGGARTRLSVTLLPSLVVVAGDRLDVREEIRFALDADTLDPESADVVDALAELLALHPEIQLLRVEGHADEEGSSRYNYDLSVRRAQAVVDALVARKIDPARLQAIGTGEARPRDLKDDSRRVDFVVLVWQ